MAEPFRLDDQFFEGVGLAALPEATRRDLAAHLVEKLACAVGARLLREVSEEATERFQELAAAGDDAGCRALLEREVPGHRDVAREEFARMVDEVRQAAPAILAAEGIAR